MALDDGLMNATSGIIEILNSDGSKLLYNINLPSRFLREFQAIEKGVLNVKYLRDTANYLLCFSENINASLNGIVNGYLYVTELMNLSITPHSSFTTGNYYVSIVPFFHGRIYYDEGSISVQN